MCCSELGWEAGRQTSKSKGAHRSPEAEMGDKGQAISQIRYPIRVTLPNGESRKLESATRLRFQQENPKLFGSMAFAAYEEYKAVTTVEDFFVQAARKNRVKESRTDLRFDVGKGYAQILEPETGCRISDSAGVEAEKKQEAAAMETPERTPETGSSKAPPGEAIKVSDAELGPSQAAGVTVGSGAVAEERLVETAAMDSSTQQGSGPSASTAAEPEEKLVQEPPHIESSAHDTAPGSETRTEDVGRGEGPATELASPAAHSSPKGASSEASPGAGGQAALKRARSQRSKSKAAEGGGDEDGGSVLKKTRQSSEASAKAKKHKKEKKEKPSEGKEEKVKKDKNKKKKKKKEKEDGPKPGAGSTEEQKEQRSRTKRKKPEGDETLMEAKARPSPSASSRLALALLRRPERSPDSKPVPTVAPALLPGGLTESGWSSLAGQPRQEQVPPAATALSATTLRVIRPSDVAQRDAVWRNQATKQMLSLVPRRDSAVSMAKACQELAPAVALLQPTAEARLATPDAQRLGTWSVQPRTVQAAPLRTASRELAEPLVSTDPAERHRAWQARLRQLLLRSVEDADQVVAYVLAQAKAGQPCATGLEVMSLEQARVELLRAGGGAKDALERERKRRAAAAKA